MFPSNRNIEAKKNRKIMTDFNLDNVEVKEANLTVAKDGKEISVKLQDSDKTAAEKPVDPVL